MVPVSSGTSDWETVQATSQRHRGERLGRLLARAVGRLVRGPGRPHPGGDHVPAVGRPPGRDADPGRRLDDGSATRARSGTAARWRAPPGRSASFQITAGHKVLLTATRHLGPPARRREWMAPRRCCHWRDCRVDRARRGSRRGLRARAGDAPPGRAVPGARGAAPRRCGTAGATGGGADRGRSRRPARPRRPRWCSSRPPSAPRAVPPGRSWPRWRAWWTA